MPANYTGQVATQGGGVAEYDYEQKDYVFVKAPNWAPAMLGQIVPMEWDLVPINALPPELKANYDNQ